MMHVKRYLEKLNFFVGNKPRVLSYQKNEVNKFIPSPHRAVVIISCDFELAWAWRFAKQINCSLEKAKEIAIKERENIPFVVELCEEFNVPLTFATVGHLFLESCEKKDGLAHCNIKRLDHFENKYWEFSSGDWFDKDPCCNWEQAKEWYAPDLLKKILGSKVKHEIACHTFSHIDCREEVCSADILKQEISECKNMAEKYGVELKSFVFPANLTGNFKAIKEEGLLAFRNDKDVLGFPEKTSCGLWQFPTTAQICPSKYKWSIEYCIRRYKTIIERAVKHRRLCHFWFHPSMGKEFLEPVLTELFQFIDAKKSELYITTMGEYAKYLENEKF